MRKKGFTKKLLATLTTTALLVSMLGMSVSAAPAMREFGMVPSARVAYIPYVTGDLYAGYEAAVMNPTILNLCDRAVATAMESYYAEQSGDVSVLNLMCNYDSLLEAPVRPIDYYLWNTSTDANYDALLTNRIMTNYYTGVIVRPAMNPGDSMGYVDVLLQTTDGSYVVYGVIFNLEADGSYTTHMCSYMAVEDPNSAYS